MNIVCKRSVSVSICMKLCVCGGVLSICMNVHRYYKS